MENLFQELLQICQFPCFYLSQYFDELKAQIDLHMATSQIKQTNDSKRLKVGHDWNELIRRVDSFEQKCYKQKLNKQTIDRINSLEARLEESCVIDLIRKENRLLDQILFQNTTIAFCKHANGDGKLVIINNLVLSKQENFHYLRTGYVLYF